METAPDSPEGGKTLRTNTFPRYAVISLLVLLTAAPAAAGELDAAREYFYDADFELAIEEIDARLEGGLSGLTLLREAHALAGQCHARLGDETAAIDAFCSALTAEPDWNPDPTLFSSEELSLYRRAYAQCPQLAVPRPGGSQPVEPAPSLAGATEGASSPWYKQKKFWIGTGAILVLLAAAGNNADQDPAAAADVPDFPDPPRSPAVQLRW